MQSQKSDNAELTEMRDYICENVDELLQKDAVELLRKLRDANVKLREKNGGVQIMMKDVSIATTLTIYNFIKQSLARY